MPTLPTLWYFADPMCSWCWGFSPVITRIREEMEGRARVALVLGGLRPGTTEAVSDQQRAETLHHWHEVHRLTGQPFRFEDAMPEGFVYDTEPACRAVVTAGELAPAGLLAFFKSVQSAFYEHGRDVTLSSVLTALAVEAGMDEAQFSTRFASEELRDRTWRHFRQTRQAGVRGFPTLIWQHDEQVQVLCQGYATHERLAGVLAELAGTTLVQ